MIKKTEELTSFYLSRRHTLLLGLVTPFALTACSSGLSTHNTPASDKVFSKPFSELDRSTLQHFIQTLLPIKGVANDVYGDVTIALINAAADDTQLSKILQDSLATLYRLSNNDWISQPLDAQVSLLKSQENQPWFLAFFFRARTEFCEHREVWNTLGYGGSSIELGGYKSQVFDEITWLPETNQ